jgi:hypothetical protein
MNQMGKIALLNSEQDSEQFNDLLYNFREKIWKKQFTKMLLNMVKMDEIKKLGEEWSIDFFAESLFERFIILYQRENTPSTGKKGSTSFSRTTNLNGLPHRFKIVIKRNRKGHLWKDQILKPDYEVNPKRTEYRPDNERKLGLKADNMIPLTKRNSKDNPESELFYAVAISLASKRIKNCVAILKHLLVLDKDLYGQTSTMINKGLKQLDNPNIKEEALNNPENFFFFKNRKELLAKMIERYISGEEMTKEWNWDNWIKNAFDKLGGSGNQESIVREVEKLTKSRSLPQDWEECVQVRLEKGSAWKKIIHEGETIYLLKKTPESLKKAQKKTKEDIKERLTKFFNEK